MTQEKTIAACANKYMEWLNGMYNQILATINLPDPVNMSTSHHVSGDQAVALLERSRDLFSIACKRRYALIHAEEGMPNLFYETGRQGVMLDYDNHRPDDHHKVWILTIMNGSNTTTYYHYHNYEHAVQAFQKHLPEKPDVLEFVTELLEKLDNLS